MVSRQVQLRDLIAPGKCISKASNSISRLGGDRHVSIVDLVHEPQRRAAEHQCKPKTLL